MPNSSQKINSSQANWGCWSCKAARAWACACAARLLFFFASPPGSPLPARPCSTPPAPAASAGPVPGVPPRSRPGWPLSTSPPAAIAPRSVSSVLPPHAVPDHLARASGGAASTRRIHAPQTTAQSPACCPLAAPRPRQCVLANLMSMLPSPHYTRSPLFVQAGTAINTPPRPQSLEAVPGNLHENLVVFCPWCLRQSSP